MSKYQWILLLIIAVVLGVLNARALDEKNPLQEVVNLGNIKIEEDQIWVEVILRKDEHKVFIREGYKITKEMPCSGGTEQDPTVMGIFYLENRGDWFYSERFDEGALYWVRFYEQYLFHSVPVDKDLKVIEEEKAKIGSPASHGCVRLLEEDAKWFYHNIPDDTMVIIHD